MTTKWHNFRKFKFIQHSGVITRLRGKGFVIPMKEVGEKKSATKRISHYIFIVTGMYIHKNVSGLREDRLPIKKTKHEIQSNKQKTVSKQSHARTKNHL